MKPWSGGGAYNSGWEYRDNQDREMAKGGFIKVTEKLFKGNGTVRNVCYNKIQSTKYWGLIV